MADPSVAEGSAAPSLSEGGGHPALADPPTRPARSEEGDGFAFEPVVLQHEGAVPLSTAPHPAAALLLIDFFLAEGQEIMAAGLHPTAIPLGDDLFAGLDPLFVPADEYFNNRERWETEYLEIIGG